MANSYSVIGGGKKHALFDFMEHQYDNNRIDRPQVNRPKFGLMINMPVYTRAKDGLHARITHVRRAVDVTEITNLGFRGNLGHDFAIQGYCRVSLDRYNHDINPTENITIKWFIADYFTDENTGTCRGTIRFYDECPSGAVTAAAIVLG